MISIVNPYCAFPFFTKAYTEAKEYPLSCPLDVFPPFCMKFSGAITTFSLSLLKLSDRSTQSINVNLVGKVCTATHSYLIYDGSAHNLTLTEESYQIILIVDGTKYFSHAFIPSPLFQTVSDATLTSNFSAGLGANEWGVTLGFNDNSQPGQKYLEYLRNGVWYRITGSGIGSGQISGTGSVSFKVRGVFVIGEGRIYSYYNASVNTADPTNVNSFVADHVEYEGTDAYQYVEWDHSTDIEEYDFYYQGSFKNRIYFRSYQDFIIPIIEDNITQNGENDFIFNSATTAEQVNITINPISQFTFSPLSVVKYHDTVRLVNPLSNTAQTIRQFTGTFAPDVENVVPSGVFTYERSKNYLDGCSENITTQAC